MTKTNKVLLIGWDAADWKVITPLVDAGKMPNMKKFLQQGVMGNLATLYPVLSPMLWTSIATGKRPYKHGVHGFIEPDPSTGSVRPVSNLSRNTKAIWNILNQEGKRCNVVGWWPSEPVEPINGVMVSNHYQDAPKHHKQPWVMRSGTIHPPRLIEPLANLRIRPQEIDAEQLLAFVPKAAEIDQTQDKRLFSVAKILAECSTVHAAATGIMQLEPWDFMGVYYDAIDHFGHGFMRYHPPKSPWISDEDFDLYQNVIESCYRFHDMMLGSLMALAGEDTTIIIVSDHGFHPDRLRPQHIPNEPAGPAEEHRPFGIVAMKGPGIKQDELVFGANLLDVTPTILTAMGLPVGQDMDGKPLVTAFETAPEVTYIDSWDEVEGDDAMHPSNLRVDPIDSQEAIQQLVDLGYVEEPDVDKEKQVAQTVQELKYNLARSYMGGHRYTEAIPILQELWDKAPAENRFGVKLFNCYLSLNKNAEAETTLEQILVSKKQCAQAAQEEIKQLSEEWKEKKPEEYTDGERRRLRKLRARAGFNTATFAFLKGSLLQAQGKYDEALIELEKAKSTQTHNLPSLYLKIGEVYLKQKNWAMAESYFQYVLNLDPVNPQVHLGLCQSYLKEGRNQEAVEAAMAAISLIYHYPQAHFYCGVALLRNQQIEDALKALQTAINQNPVFPVAHRVLAFVYRKHFQDKANAKKHRQLAKEAWKRIKNFREGKITIEENPQAIRDWFTDKIRQNQPLTEPNAPLEESITIVSGLPRSGTSMMMQMLATGGLTAATDEARKADESNSRGYYELEKVTKLAADNSWLGDIQGQAVKIIAQLLPRLPQGYPYRIIFMQRDIDSIIASQTKMLGKLGKTGANLSPEKLTNTFNKQLASVKNILEHYNNIQVLYLDYDEVIENPISAASRVNQFLDRKLDENKMITVVAPELRHQQQVPISSKNIK